MKLSESSGAQCALGKRADIRTLLIKQLKQVELKIKTLGQ